MSAYDDDQTVIGILTRARSNVRENTKDAALAAACDEMRTGWEIRSVGYWLGRAYGRRRGLPFDAVASIDEAIRLRRESGVIG